LSTSSNFRTTPGAAQPYKAGFQDGLIVWLDTAGQGLSDLRYSTYFGGNNPSIPSSRSGLSTVLVEDSGVITACGFTDGGFQGTPGAWQQTSSPRDALLVRLDPRGNGPVDVHYASFLSPAAGTNALAAALHGDGLVTMAGITIAVSHPTSANALQPYHGGGGADGFVTQFDPLPRGIRRHGQSTPACRGPIWLQVNENPTAGSRTFTLLNNGAPLGAVGALVLGSRQPAPMRILGADVWVSLDLFLPALADAQGAWRQQLPLPGYLPSPPSMFLQLGWLNAPSCPGGPLSASHAIGL
jgi:hypothetical protein